MLRGYLFLLALGITHPLNPIHPDYLIKALAGATRQQDRHNSLTNRQQGIQNSVFNQQTQHNSMINRQFTANPQLLTANPQLMTSNPQLMTSNPPLMTSNPQLMTSNSQLITTNPQRLTTNPLNFTAQQNYPMTNNNLTYCFNAAQQLTNYF